MLRFFKLLVPRPGRALVVLTATAILATGCSTLTPGDHAKPLAREVANAAAPPAAKPECQVELRSKSGKTQVRKVELTGDEHVGDVLAQTGALRKYSQCEVAVLRQQPNGAIAKMTVSLAPSQRQVTAESDYFLHPKDRLLVQEVDTTPMEQMMGGAFGSMRGRKK